LESNTLRTKDHVDLKAEVSAKVGYGNGFKGEIPGVKLKVCETKQQIGLNLGASITKKCNESWFNWTTKKYANVELYNGSAVDVEYGIGYSQATGVKTTFDLYLTVGLSGVNVKITTTDTAYNSKGIGAGSVGFSKEFEETRDPITVFNHTYRWPF